MKTIKRILILILPFIIGCSSVGKYADYSSNINDGWFMISSEKITDVSNLLDVQQIKQSGAHLVQLPATVLSGLIQNGFYPDIYYSNNIDTVSEAPFQKSWFYFKEFDISDWSQAEYYSLVFEGINYQANIWLNGCLLVDSIEIEGPFRIFDLDITSHAQAHNLLVVEVFHRNLLL